MKVKSEREVAPISMQFSMQEYWIPFPFPPPGDLPDPGTEPVSPALAGGFFTTEPPGKPKIIGMVLILGCKKNIISQYKLICV